MADLEPFLVLASAVAEGRISPVEFTTVCLPLYKSYTGSYPSPEHFQAATDLFYVACDHDPGGAGPKGALGDEQVRSAAAEIARRMRSLLQ